MDAERARYGLVNPYCPGSGPSRRPGASAAPRRVLALGALSAGLLAAGVGAAGVAVAAPDPGTAGAPGLAQAQPTGDLNTAGAGSAPPATDSRARFDRALEMLWDRRADLAGDPDLLSTLLAGGGTAEPSDAERDAYHSALLRVAEQHDPGSGSPLVVGGQSGNVPISASSSFVQFTQRQPTVSALSAVPLDRLYLHVDPASVEPTLEFLAELTTDPDIAPGVAGFKVAGSGLAWSRNSNLIVYGTADAIDRVVAALEQYGSEHPDAFLDGVPYFGEQVAKGIVRSQDPFIVGPDGRDAGAARRAAVQAALARDPADLDQFRRFASEELAARLIDPAAPHRNLADAGSRILGALLSDGSLSGKYLSEIFPAVLERAAQGDARALRSLDLDTKALLTDLLEQVGYSVSSGPELLELLGSAGVSPDDIRELAAKDPGAAAGTSARVRALVDGLERSAAGEQSPAGEELPAGTSQVIRPRDLQDEVITRLGRGEKPRDIATALNIAPGTVTQIQAALTAAPSVPSVPSVPSDSPVAESGGESDVSGGASGESRTAGAGSGGGDDQGGLVFTPEGLDPQVTPPEPVEFPDDLPGIGEWYDPDPLPGFDLDPGRSAADSRLPPGSQPDDLGQDVWTSPLAPVGEIEVLTVTAPATVTTALVGGGPGTQAGEVRTTRNVDGTTTVQVRSTRVTNPDGTVTLFTPVPPNARDVSWNPDATRTTFSAVVAGDPGGPGSWQVQQRTLRYSSHQQRLVGDGKADITGSVSFHPNHSDRSRQDITVFPTQRTTMADGSTRYTGVAPKGVTVTAQQAATGVLTYNNVPVGTPMVAFDVTSTPRWSPPPPVQPPVTTTPFVTAPQVTTPRVTTPRVTTPRVTTPPFRTPSTPARPSSPTATPRPTPPAPVQNRPNAAGGFLDGARQAALNAWNDQPITVTDLPGGKKSVVFPDARAVYDSGGNKISGDLAAPNWVNPLQLVTPGQALDELGRIIQNVPVIPIPGWDPLRQLAY